MLQRLIITIIIFIFSSYSYAERSIIVGCPLSTGFVYGWDAERAIKLAVEEINKKGGVRIKGKVYK